MTETESNGAAVELREVTKQFGDFVAVRKVSLTIREGEFFTLLGPSGCGKTTSLRMIAGFEIPTQGEIYIQNRLMGLTPPFQRNANMVFQNYALFPHMTVYQNVAFGLEMKRLSRDGIQQQVDQALEMVQLGGYQSRSPKQLSGGEQQRVALARALVNQPGVLLLDEPLGALDLKLRKAMQLELKELQSRLGITFIYVTHDQEEALTMSDRLAVMHQGEVLQIGTPGEVYERPTTRFVADFIGESNFFNGILGSTEADLATLEVSGLDALLGAVSDGCRVGEQATLTVRPEKIDISATRPGEARNLVHGEVEEVVYLGTDTSYLVRGAHGDIVRVRQQNEDALAMQPAHQVGDAVYLSWQPTAGRLITR